MIYFVFMLKDRTDCSVDDVNEYVFHSIDHVIVISVWLFGLMLHYEQLLHVLLNQHKMHVTYDLRQQLTIVVIDAILQNLRLIKKNRKSTKMAKSIRYKPGRELTKLLGNAEFKYPRCE